MLNMTAREEISVSVQMVSSYFQEISAKYLASLKIDGNYI